MNSQNSNKRLNKFISNTGNAIRKTKKTYNNIHDTIQTTPLRIKIVGITVPVGLTYIFTYINFNLPLSITFAILSFFAIFLLSIPFAFIFILIYSIIVNNIRNKVNDVLGTPFKETDIVKSTAPYSCLAKPLIIDSKRIPQNINSAYFTYSFWLFINGNNNEVNKGNNWYSYRYNEWKSVFYRGSDMQTNLDAVIQYPGVWLTPVLNNLVFVFKGANYIERVEITNVPLNQWMNYAIVVETKSVSLYVNGLLDRTINLSQGTIDTNNYAIHIADDKLISSSYERDHTKGQGGFAGYLGELTYYNYSLNSRQIKELYNHYKKIIDNYQIKKVSDYKYTVSNIITNSDIQK